VADKTSTAAQVAPGDAPNISLFTAFSTPQFPSDEGNWLLHSGCCNHVTGSHKCFTTYTPIPKRNKNIRVGNNYEIVAFAQGNVTLTVWEAGEK